MSTPKSHKAKIPIQITLDGVEVTGEIVSLWPNDLSVVILTPMSGLATSVHIPWFQAGYPQFRLADGSGITDFGIRRARALLKELYDFSQGRPSGWGISRLGHNGRWKDVEFDYDAWPVKEKGSVGGGRLAGLTPKHATTRTARTKASR